MFRSNYNIAVLLPCYNEEVTIGQTVDAFKRALPFAKIYVYDNNSTDGTRAILDKKDVIVHSVHRQGKGNVVRRMFADIEADIYVLCDTDNAFDATEAPKLIGSASPQRPSIW
jgi:glycosyltransferase involved in cell wall biosynthesis